MPTPMPIPPALPPLVGCTLALLSLWLGWRTLRTRAIPPLLRPMVQANRRLVEAMQGEDAGRRAAPTPDDTVRIYGWAWIYAGTFGLVVAGGQLVRLIAGAIGG